MDCSPEVPSWRLKLIRISLNYPRQRPVAVGTWDVTGPNTCAQDEKVFPDPKIPLSFDDLPGPKGNFESPVPVIPARLLEQHHRESSLPV